MNKYLKRILSIFIVLTLTLTSIGIFTTTTSASSSTFEYMVDGGTTRKSTASDLYINYTNPVLNVAGENAFEGAKVTINKAGTGRLYDMHMTVVDSFRVVPGETLTFIVTSNYAEYYEKTIYLDDMAEGGFTEIRITFDIDNQRPAIDGQENFVTNVDDAKPLAFFQAYLSAWDETDGDVTDRIKVESDDYTPNMRVLGTHEVKFYVTDKSNNRADLTVYIRVVDVTIPRISGSTAVATVGYKETYNIESFKSTLTVFDNYDTIPNSRITIKSDGYTANKTKLGTYKIVFEVADNSGNKGTFEKSVRVIDNVVPTFSGPTQITTSNATILTESDVREQLTAHDEIDNNLTTKIKLVEDNFTGKGTLLGSFTIKYSVTDNAGNTAYHTVTITRNDKIPPVIWIQDGVSIKTTPTTPLTFDQIIQVLQATGQITVTAETKFSILLDEYTGNEETPGTYAYSLRARSTNGNESVHNLGITVLDVKDNEDDITIKPDFDIIVWFKENKIPIIIVSSLILIVAGLFVFRKKRK